MAIYRMLTLCIVVPVISKALFLCDQKLLQADFILIYGITIFVFQHWELLCVAVGNKCFYVIVD